MRNFDVLLFGVAQQDRFLESFILNSDAAKQAQRLRVNQVKGQVLTRVSDRGSIVYNAAVSNDAHPLWVNEHRPSAWLKISQV
ncbi:MAG: hypothetical protein LJE96_09390 [Deltaproteobacteria bacterium]|nr:hypothetical protein [Deltaproteobacteria bacterium]